MKKLLILILALMLSLSLFACDKPKGNGNGGGENGTTQEQPSDTGNPDIELPFLPAL
ncbi:MAG: hypothetical protein IJY57_04905 [Clostridia bacterium]|nr:hypothetical protein [Clostridia bacterium]